MTETSSRTALVTGGSSGIGLELARCYAEDGHDLVLVARDEARLDLAARELGGRAGGRAITVPMDLSEPGAAGRLVEELDRRGVEVRALVNSAGFGYLGPYPVHDLEHQLRMIALNVTTLTELTARYLPRFLEAGDGEILNLGSTASFQAGPGMAVYYATKAYVLHFTEAIAHEVRGSPVRVSCLCPGPTRTNFVVRAGGEGRLVYKLAFGDARQVAHAGYRGLRRGRTIVVPGLLNKFGVLAAKIAPRVVARRVVTRLNR